MTTLVTADEKGRVSLRAQPGRKYLVIRSGAEWRVAPYKPEAPRSRNCKEWAGAKNGRDIMDAIGELGRKGLRIEESEESKQPVPPCKF